MNNILTWKEIVKLGKKEVCFRLMARQSQFDSRGNYFSLCKILNDSQYSPSHTITRHSIDKLSEKLEELKLIHSIAKKSGNARAAQEALKAVFRANDKMCEVLLKHQEERKLWDISKSTNIH